MGLYIMHEINENDLYVLLEQRVNYSIAAFDWKYRKACMEDREICLYAVGSTKG